MIDVTCKLIKQNYITDEIGNHVLKDEYIEIPIIEVQDVFQNEFYNAAQQGIKPTLRLLISDLNYDDEEELEYMDKRYVIVRVDRVNNENIALVCEKRVGVNAN